MTWVDDKFSPGKALDVLRRRQGDRYAWGEWKREPDRDACQCQQCAYTRNDLVNTLQKQCEAADCPENVNRLKADPFGDWQPGSLASMYEQALKKAFGYSEWRLSEPSPWVVSQGTANGDQAQPKKPTTVTTTCFIYDTKFEKPADTPVELRPQCPSCKALEPEEVDIIREQFKDWDRE